MCFLKRILTFFAPTVPPLPSVTNRVTTVMFGRTASALFNWTFDAPAEYVPPAPMAPYETPSATSATGFSRYPQGSSTAIGDAPGTSSPIVRHADIRRMLLTMRSQVEAAEPELRQAVLRLQLAPIAQGGASR